MARRNLLSDETYNKELDRMRMMKRFPEAPTARREMIRAMRKITVSNYKFLHDVITYFVDYVDYCPTPHELIERAGDMRTSETAGYSDKPLGNPACLKCGGTGWLHATRIVQVSGMQPYKAEFAARCECAPSAPRPEAE